MPISVLVSVAPLAWGPASLAPGVIYELATFS